MWVCGTQHKTLDPIIIHYEILKNLKIIIIVENVAWKDATKKISCVEYIVCKVFTTIVVYSKYKR